MAKAMPNTLDELKKKGEMAMKRSRLQEIALTASSPTQAEKMALREGFGPKQAKSCWALASIKKHFGREALKTHIEITEPARAWQTPVIMSLSFALIKKWERDSFDYKHASVMKQRKGLPTMDQPMDASYWMSRSQQIGGTPVGTLSSCFQGLINHYEKEAVADSFVTMKREVSGMPGFGILFPRIKPFNEVCEHLRNETHSALDETMRFIIRTFSRHDVDSAWEKSKTK